MAYYDIINDLKSALDGYSDEEARLSALYKNAYDAAEKSYKAEQEALDKEYLASRNRVYSDSARDERNNYALLAERGLGFSGEAAQAKLNSNVLLSNRLGELESKNAESRYALDKDYSDKKHTLSLEYLDKAGAANDEKNRLKLDIASLEQKAANDEADRAFEKEKLDAQLKADADALALRLKADADTLDKKLKAEREMLDAELYAKYYSQTQAGSGSGGGKGNGTGGEDLLEDILNGYMPDITPKDLAKLMVTNATDDNFITDEKGDYLINKYLLDMYENYDMDSDYMKELIFMLKAYGYDQIDLSGMRVKVISHEAKAYYDESYVSNYDRYARAGASEADARSNARASARRSQLEYIRSRVSSLDEFLQCCKNAGISDSEANEYASRYKWTSDTENAGKTHGGNGNKLITNMLK